MEIHTWARVANKFFTYRDFEIYDGNKNLCAIATSKWTLINIEEGKMSKITEDVINSYKPEEKEVFEKEKLEKIQEPKEFISSIKYEIKRKDIDINKHMHNLYYLDYAYEALPEEVYKKPEIALSWVYEEEPWAVVSGFSSPEQPQLLNKIEHIDTELKKKLTRLADEISKETNADNIFAHRWM